MWNSLLLFKLILLIGVVQFVAANQCDVANSIGNEFIFGFIGGYSNLGYSYVHLLVESTTDTNTTVQIIVPHLNYDETTTFINHTEVGLSTSILQYGGTLTDFKAIEVYSDTSITVSATVIYDDYTEGFLVLPTSALGMRYVAASYQPYSTYNNEILVVGTQHNTDINVNYTLNGKHMWNSTRLQRYETYQLSVNNDLSGTLITSNKPIAVISGSALSQIPVNVGSYQYLIEQMVPTKYWGHKYIVPPIYPHKFSIMKLFSDQDNTEIHYYNSTRHAAEYMNRGSVVEIMLGSDPVVIVSSKPISVVQYNMDNEVLNSDPFMTNTQSMSQFADSYIFYSPDQYVFITTLVVTIEFAQLSGLRLNGRSISFYNSVSVRVSDPMGSYVTVFANITQGTLYNIDHVDRGVYFGASLYGAYSSATSYGYPLGYTLKSSNCNTDHITTATSQPSKGETTTKPDHGHHWTPPQHQQGEGTWCFECSDIYSLAHCDTVTRCSDNQTCYVQRYKRSQSTYLYKSGCVDRNLCSVGDIFVECHECCDGQFCNTHGCGDAGLEYIHNHGPYCFDCAHQRGDQFCGSVQLCRADQVCSIETKEWGDGVNHIKGCVDKKVCDSRSSRSVSEQQSRSTSVCTQCCETDFCNNNCTTVNIASIIG